MPIVAFVTRLSTRDIENEGVISVQKPQAEFSVTTPKQRSNATIFSRHFSCQSFMGDDPALVQAGISFTSSGSGEVVQYDVFERHGFDRIMKTVANATNDQEEIAKCICETLEAVALLSSDR
jgi:hypothetical protein